MEEFAHYDFVAMFPTRKKLRQVSNSFLYIQCGLYHERNNNEGMFCVVDGFPRRRDQVKSRRDGAHSFTPTRRCASYTNIS